MINTSYILPIFVLIICLIALYKKINAFHSFTEGVKDGFSLFFEIYPSLLAMMFAIALLRESGLMELASQIFIKLIPDIPSEIWPMIIFRPISGNASIAILADIFKVCGVDSLQGTMASIIQGSTDTTIYVLTLYFSSVGIKKTKNALGIGLLADVAGISMAIFLTLMFFS